MSTSARSSYILRIWKHLKLFNFSNSWPKLIFSSINTFSSLKKSTICCSKLLLFFKKRIIFACRIHISFVRMIQAFNCSILPSSWVSTSWGELSHLLNSCGILLWFVVFKIPLLEISRVIHGNVFISSPVYRPAIWNHFVHLQNYY